MWVKHREAQFSGQYSVATQSKGTLARVGAMGKKEGLTMLERRRARSAKGSVTARLHASLARIGTIVKKEGLTILGRRHARSGSNSLAGPAQSQASSLKRVRTINKLAGLEKRERRNAQVFTKQSVPNYLAPECAACLLTPPPLVRHANVEDSDVSEDARIAFAMWVKKRIEAAEASL
ncbi:hypothetical protein AX15_007354 [Amanita polypyramis BW_CC]|nr:hypothetical protein AX15_007354 [Amanita polypyramis BW_CC]